MLPLIRNRLANRNQAGKTAIIPNPADADSVGIGLSPPQPALASPTEPHSASAPIAKQDPSKTDGESRADVVRTLPTRIISSPAPTPRRRVRQESAPAD